MIHLKHFKFSILIFSFFLTACGDCLDNANCNDSGGETPINRNEFVSIWKTDNQGASESNQIKIDTFGEGYDYNIDWGDGKTDNSVAGDITHTYEAPGTYTVKISGTFPQIYFEKVEIEEDLLGDIVEVFTSDNGKILSIEQWGNIDWRSMHAAFRDAKNLKLNATDEPDLAAVTNMSEMFSGASSLNQSINAWDVSNVTNFSAMFAGAINFNQSIASWDVSNATDMSKMFFEAESFNQGISGWDVSNVTNMSGMFWKARAFNQGLAAWNVSSVADMSMMFVEAESFDQAIGQWDVSNVTNFSSMFAAAKKFNQSLTDWDVSAVTDISRIFWKAESFNQSIDSWDVSSVTNMSSAFQGALSFNQTLSTWNVINVTDMSQMFSGASMFSQDLDNWDIGSVLDMDEMIASTALTTDQYDALLNSWSRLSVKSGVSLGAGNLQYSAQSSFARDSLIVNSQWSISDGGLSTE